MKNLFERKKQITFARRITFRENNMFKKKTILYNDDRAFDRQSKGPRLDTQRSGSVPFFTENFFNLY